MEKGARYCNSKLARRSDRGGGGGGADFALIDLSGNGERGQILQ